ncbi:DinB family protein [Sphingobium agri]|uniref:DinB family protein n=1 Tax=Sphingobium agri TaxID=2933566 RepID=A0ABT0DUF4_9SPHN|nr:DinB family protein [Sphingobium agri]MCK0530689.1 DinB family protein [Sphingobium agri]
MIVSARDQIALMARYHGWATERLLKSIAPMPDDLYRKQCGLFFGSVHGSLNHLLLADSLIWYPRLSGGSVISRPLDAEIESDRAALESRLIIATAQWPRLIESLDEIALSGDLHFVMTTGQPRILSMAAALFHVFNHATHHRGQITAAMSMMGFEYEPLDLPQLIYSELA